MSARTFIITFVSLSQIIGATATGRRLGARLRAFPKQADLGTRQHIGEFMAQYPQAHQ